MNGPPDADIAVFTEALRLPPEKRNYYLGKACGGDIEFRRRVEALLLAFEQAGDFLGRPAAARPSRADHAFRAGEKPGNRIGRYKLLEQIGEGGCGVVFMAEQQEPVRRRVALKIIKPGMDTNRVIARFEAERQALALMNHPNIARVFDGGSTESGRPYFVMELVRGLKITEYCDQNFSTTEERLKMFIQVCQAVQHAHQKGIIHRDIKPSNVLVTTTEAGEPLPVVIDFGVAKAINQQLTAKTLFTAFDMLIGTPAYMSPEQAALTNVDVDTRSDIYSLGVLLYELLTGSTPFDTEALLKSGFDEIRRVIREEDPVRPSTRLSTMAGETLTTVAQRRRSEVPRLIRTVCGDLDWIAMKAMEKVRARRYETATSLALDVEHFLAYEPITARPPGAAYKFQKLVLRNKLLFVGLGVISALLVASLIVVSTSLSQERQSQREAEQVKQFLEETLQGVTPEVALGRDTTILREILDKAAARIDRETNQPAVAAELRSVIGTVYERTGQYRQAEDMQRAALAICQERFGQESPEAAAALNELGVTLIASGKKLEAERVCREALEIRRRRFGNENADVATSEDNLAHACNDNGKFTEAEALIAEALATRRRLFGNESQEVIDSLRNQALILGNTGKRAEAEVTAREVLELRRKLLGPQDPSISGALYDLAWAEAANGKRSEAEALEREAFVLRQKVLSDNYPDVAESLYVLGDRMRQHGNLEDAYSVLNAALSLQRKFLGDDHPSTLYTLSALGLVYEAEGNWPESETLARQVLASWRKQEGDADPQTLYAMRSLAEVYEAQGKWAEAEPLHREAFAAWLKRSGNGDAQTLWECDRLYRALVSQRKYNEADQLLAQVLTPTFMKEPACSSVLAHRLDLMGRQGRWAEAAADATTLMKYQPTNYYWSYNVFALLVMTHNRPAYEKLCQRIPASFADTSNPYTAQRIADGCLLLPDSGADRELIERLATKAVTMGNGDGDGFFQACKALSEYRGRRFSQAVEWAEKAPTNSELFARAQGTAVLAMAQWRLGLKDAARATLNQGNTLAPEISSGHAVDLGDGWLDWLVARILLNEANGLMADNSASVNNSNDQQ